MKLADKDPYFRKLKTLLVACFVSITSVLMAQPEYANWTGGTSGGNSIPYSWVTAGCRGEQLFPAGDFGAVPAGKQISRIYYYTQSSGNGSADYDFLKIFLKQENVSALNSGSYTTGMTEVLSSTNFNIQNVNGQWFSIELDQPFPFNPNLPLIVHVQSHMNPFDAWYCGVAPAATGAWRSWAQPYTASNPTGNGSYRMMFGFDLIDGGTLPYCQNFEESAGGFEGGGILSTWEYGNPTNTSISGAFSGDSAWVTNLDGDHNNDELSYVRSVKFDMTELTDPMMKFWCNYDLENGNDGVAVEVSGDSGNTWATLGSTSSSGPWYNSSSIAALTAQGNGNGWTGQSNGWVPMEHSLASYNNDTAVFIRWKLAADGTQTDEGFGLDDIYIGESNDIELVDILYPDSICGNSNTTIRAEICNRSYEPRYGFGIDVDTNGVTVAYTYPDTIDVCECETISVLTFNTSNGGYWDIDVAVNNNGDVNPGNDTASGDILTWATPAIELSGGGNWCQNELGELTFDLKGTAPWDFTFTNGVTPTVVTGVTTTPITVTTNLSGNFEVIYLGDSTGCPADTSNISGSATIAYIPIAEVDLGPDDEFCSGHVLDAGAGYSAYSWSLGGATTQTLNVSTTGNVSVTVTDSLGCTDSDTIYITMLDVPVITISDTVLCEGTTFIFNAGSGSASYVWHDGSTSQVYPMTSTGTVSVTVTGFNGCQSSKSATITGVVPNPTPTLTSTSSSAPVTLDAGTGYNAYLWNTNESTQTILAYQAGTYTCTVTDANGCKGNGSVEADIWTTGLDEMAVDDIAIYPVPADDYVMLRIAGQSIWQDAEIELFDVLGQSVRKQTVSDVITRIETTQLPPGTYSITIRNDEAEFEKSLIITH
ncbi:MAG: hypothetical protein Salg2KO_06100 [Salibacteraceae bacterium]